MAQKFVKDSIVKKRVVIFSKSGCPFCKMAKDVRVKNNDIAKILLEQNFLPICFQ